MFDKDSEVLSLISRMSHKRHLHFAGFSENYAILDIDSPKPKWSDIRHVTNLEYKTTS